MTIIIWRGIILNRNHIPFQQSRSQNSWKRLIGLILKIAILLPFQLTYSTRPNRQRSVSIAINIVLRFYKIFRGILNTEEISERSFLLSTLMLHLKTTNYYAMMLRSKFFIKKQHNIEEIKRQLYFCNCILNSNPKEYQIWTYKKLIFDTFKGLVNQSEELYQN